MANQAIDDREPCLWFHICPEVLRINGTMCPKLQSTCKRRADYEKNKIPTKRL